MKCVICGRELSNPVSIRRGMGPVCFAHQIEAVSRLAEEPVEDMDLFVLPDDSLLYSQAVSTL